MPIERSEGVERQTISQGEMSSADTHFSKPELLDASDLSAVISRAMALFDKGDVLAAKLLAGQAYKDAKSAAQLGERFGAAERLIRKAHQLQGDALLIETRAKMRLADEWDGAQERGEAAKQGRKSNISDGNVFTLEQVGLTAKEIHEARKLRDAETKSPGIAAAAIAARLAQGLEPTKASLSASIGTRTRTKEERGDDFYPTPFEAVETLLGVEELGGHVVEPACGKGDISRHLEANGIEVLISDLVDRQCLTRHGEVQGVGDFLQSKAGDFGDDPVIVTNPPFGIANQFIAHALRVHRPRKMAMLLNLNFLCGFEDPDRNFVMDDMPPARVHVFTRRLPMMHQDGWDGKKSTSQMNTAWFVWERVDLALPDTVERLFFKPPSAKDRGFAKKLAEKFPYGRQTQLMRRDWRDFLEGKD